jgi:hypothetical protein
MSVFLATVLQCVASFLMGMGMAAAAVFGDTALVSILLSVGFLWFFSKSMRTSEQAA